jgi:hypothetical protein
MQNVVMPSGRLSTQMRPLCDSAIRLVTERPIPVPDALYCASGMRKAPVGGGEIEQATDPHYRDAQATQWNATIERAITNSTALRVSYVGMASYRLNVRVNLNQQVPSSVAPNPTPIPFPNWGTMFSTENYGHQSYKAMEVQVTQRMAPGLALTKAWEEWPVIPGVRRIAAPIPFQGNYVSSTSRIFRHSGMTLVFRTTFEVCPRAGTDNSLERLTERRVGLVTDRPSNVYELFVTLFE